jgi:uncharacterized protein (DUF169 family)
VIEAQSFHTKQTQGEKKMNTNYAEIAKTLSRAVGLTKPLVAVKLFDDPHTVPEGLPVRKARCTTVQRLDAPCRARRS